MKKHYETHVEDTDKLISVAGPVLDYKSWYEQYRKLMEEQAQRKYGLYTPTSEGDEDDFPSIPGMIARYSVLGLTNEQMEQNPVWVDKTGNGHDLQMKNLAWGGMSGVGGYVDNWNSSADWAVNSYWVNSHTDHKLQFITASTVVQVKSKNVYNAENVYKNILNVNGLTEAVNKGAVSRLEIFVTDSITSKVIKIFSFETDGVIQISFDDVLQDYYVNYFVMGNNTNDIDITIEQLPLYPGFILGDGVDDFAVTEKELNFEDTYTVYTAFIPFQVDPVRAMEMCGKDFKKDFYLYYSNTHIVYYTSGLNNYIPVRINQFHIIVCKRNKTNAVIKNLITGESKTFSVSELIDNPGVYYLWRYTRSGTSTAKSAIAGQTICNGYFSTDEDDEKVLDWHKKQYPWLFPDQAWTVVGKTNEDEDRATIANITGNGNDLILSNFGFAEGSGYGLYGFKFIPKAGVEYYSGSRLSFSKRQLDQITLNPYILIFPGSSYPKGTDITAKIKVAGLKEGVSLIWGWAGNIELTITEDGTYSISAGIGKLRSMNVVYAEDFDPDHVVTIEQIPEYEGYLVTDGVDDKVESSPFTLNKDWTIVGNWTMLSNIPSNCGIIKVSSMFLYNSLDGVTIYFAGGPIKIQSKSINAFCSDGRIYLNDWTEILKPDAQIASGGSKSSLNIASYSANFTKMAFKNLAIYDGKNLSKDDCIKAYNYLQTLKAK